MIQKRRKRFGKALAASLLSAGLLCSMVFSSPAAEKPLAETADAVVELSSTISDVAIEESGDLSAKSETVIEESNAVFEQSNELSHQVDRSMAKFAANQLKGTVVITSEDQLTGMFPDPVFRAVVFEQVKNGQYQASGSSIEEALGNFVGTISYDGKKQPIEKRIADIHGIEYLTHAARVIVTHNEIRDFTFLVQAFNPNPVQNRYGLTEQEFADYEQRHAIAESDPDYDEDEDPEFREGVRNVYWSFGGNPIEKLPETFGGMLDIAQAGSTSYTYPEDLCDDIVYLRPQSEDISGILDVAKAKIGSKWVNLIQVSTDQTIMTFLFDKDDPAHSNQYVPFEGLKRTATPHIAIGCDKDLHYATVDEFGTITEGSQSFKYYLQPTFWVYDRVLVADPAVNATATLTKTETNNTTKPVPGAVYGLYKADGTKISTLTTDAKGKITATNLAVGEYYFQETTAPDGYVLNTGKVNFTVTKPATALGGGLSSIKTQDGTTKTAAAGERYIAGPDKNGESPDLTLTSTDEGWLSSLSVTYSRLYDENSVEQNNVTRPFTSMADAVADINTEKNANNILGVVTINPTYTANSAGGFFALTTTNTPLPESSEPSSTPESSEPSSTPESSEPSSTPESSEPSSAPESSEPSSAPESSEPSSALESSKPSSTPESSSSSKPGVPTGDSSSSLPFYVSLLCLSVSALIVVLYRKKSQ